MERKKTKQTLLFGEGTVEDLEKSRRMFKQLAEAIFKPVIAQRGWEDAVTEKMKLRIFWERAKQIRENEGNKMDVATDYEALIFIMTATFTTPLSRVWMQIYEYLFRKFYPKQAEDIFDGSGTKLELQAEYELSRLKRWLWRRACRV